MRTVEKTNKFKKDLKRERQSPFNRDLEKRLNFIVNLLCSDFDLPRKFADHPLKGKRRNSRECHLKPDLLLVYKKIGDEVLLLEELGSHSELDF